MVKQVLGNLVDRQTRCIHYRTPLDVVAIKFRCCLEYYPCHLCHQECADHPALQWSVEEHETLAVLCGVCRHEFSISRYLGAENCPQCRTSFNPRCRLHAHLYFYAGAQ
ncbi:MULTISPECIES: CHY zinc finger protein [unclassified Nesterenkonia]|uniref:CHY zinc finger protein n=1 Tax=unclassified Nesterenkonia TaxID=2629769 RepID=UPI003145439C